MSRIRKQIRLFFKCISKQFRRFSKFIREYLGPILTAIYLLLAGSYVYSNFNDISCLPANELGDFFAGAVGPLAIFWLILAYYQQGHALQKQIEELNKTVEHQGEIAAATKAQVDLYTRVFKEERNAEILRNQPLFELINNGKIVFNRSIERESEYVSYSFSLLLKNSGEKVSDVVINTISEQLSFPAYERIRVFDSGQEFNIDFAFPIHTHWDQLFIKINCKTVLNTKHINSFKIRNNDIEPYFLDPARTPRTLNASIFETFVSAADD